MPPSAVFVLLFLGAPDAAAMGRMTPRERRFVSADGLHAVAVARPPATGPARGSFDEDEAADLARAAAAGARGPSRPEAAVAAVYAERPGGAPSFVPVSSFPVVSNAVPAAGFVADGGGAFLALDEPWGEGRPALTLYSLPSGRALTTLRHEDLFDPMVRTLWAGPGKRWAQDVAFAPVWHDGVVTGVSVGLPWGQSLRVRFGNGFVDSAWDDPRLRPDRLDEASAWRLFEEHRSTHVRRGLVAFVGLRGSSASVPRLRRLLEDAATRDASATALVRLAPEEIYAAAERSPSWLTRSRMLAALVEAAPASGTPPPSLKALAERMAFGDRDPRVRRHAVACFVHLRWASDPATEGRLRDGLRSEKDPEVRAEIGRWLKFLAQARPEKR